MNVRRNRILVLDADAQTLIELEHLLEDEGFDTTTTWDTPEALHLALTRQFDLLLIGNHPPEIDAGEVLRWMDRERASLQCFILQNRCRVSEAEYFYSLGANGVISDWRSVDLGQWMRTQLSLRIAVAGG